MSGKDRGDETTSAPTQSVVFVCDAGHTTEIKFHVQVKDLPPQWNCKVCHKLAVFAASITPQSDETVPDPRRGYVDPSVLQKDERPNPLIPDYKGKHFTPEHHAELRARRTDEELEKLLEERLAILRSGGGERRFPGF